jgi:hypothetical protein
VNDPDVRLLIILVLLAGLAGALWYFRDDLLPASDDPAAIEIAPAAEETPASTGPAHPITPDPTESLEGKLVPLPDHDDSDSYFLLTLVDTFGPDFGAMLVNEALIDKFVATVDSLPRKSVPEKVRPVSKLYGAFAADSTDDKEPFYLSANNYGRYDQLVGAISRADPDAMVAVYRRFYPLLQESYVRLGYPDGYFNDRVVAVFDHLLSAPTPEEPFLIVQPHVLYEYADPQLEALSSGQKLLLRMGSAHAVRVKAVLRELRTRIAQP